MNNKLWVGIIIAVLVIIVAGAFFFSQKEKEPVASIYDSFAQCLAGANLVMYSSITCPFCAQQKAMFGSAFRFIREIECDPRNPFPQTELCIAKKISHTPTWILEDADGNIVTRLEPGVQTFETLGALAGCPLTAPVAEDDVASGADNAAQQ